MTTPAARLRNRQLTAAMHEVFSRLFGYEPMAVYSPDAFLKLMWMNLPQFSGFNQQDAEEFVRALVNRLDEEATAAASAEAGAESGAAAAAPTGAAAGGSSSAVAHMLGGTVVTTITCTVCGAESRREETFLGPLSMEVPAAARITAPTRGAAAVSLEECLNEAFGTEVMEGANAYECSKCGKRVKAELRRRLLALPPILMLHVVRTAWSLASAKVHTAVTPVYDGLDLAAWTAPEAAARHATLYDLHGIVRHVGSGIRQGHYIAYARNDTRDTWYCFNDARVTPVSDDELAEVQAYLLVYQRHHMPPSLPGAAVDHAS